jgi:hypothetical protein
MPQVDINKIKDLILQSQKLGFAMGVTAMRLKLMESLAPYIDLEVIDSDLFTVRDSIQLVLDSLKDFDQDTEFLKIYEVMVGLGQELSDE